MLIPSVVALAWSLWVGRWSTATPPRQRSPCANVFFMGTVMLLSAAGDLRMLLRGGVFGNRRIVRHLCGCASACSSPPFFLSRAAAVFPLAAWFTCALSSSAAATSSDDFLAPACLVFVGLAQASRRKACRLTIIPTAVTSPCVATISFDFSSAPSQKGSGRRRITDHRSAATRPL